MFSEQWLFDLIGVTSHNGIPMSSPGESFGGAVTRGVPGAQSLEQANKHATDLYWLAFILTGRSGPSGDLALEVIDSKGGEGSFFSAWMVAWSRRLVIAKALTVLRDELAASVRRTASSASST